MGRGQRMFLYNSFVEYQRLNDAEQRDHLVRVVDFIIESRRPRPEGDAALNQLLPVIRARSDLLAVTADSQGFPYDQSSRVFCESMLLMLAIDSEVSIGLVTDEILEGLGVSFEDALGIAIAHLDERGGHRFGQLAEGTFVSQCEDYYDASRILIPDLLAQLPLAGNPVAILQARSAILVTGSEDNAGLAMIAQFVLDDFAENERAISLSPIEWVDGEWRPFVVRENHPSALRNLKPNQLCWTYNATSASLQKKLGDDVYVANALLVEKDGLAATAATWAAGVPTACPLVDAVLIEEQDEFPQIIRSLADVLGVCGPFEDVTAMPYPQRWMLPATMGDEQRRELTERYAEHVFFPDDSQDKLGA